MGHSSQSCDELENYKEWLNAVESELKSTRASDVAVVATHVLVIPQKVTSTRWAFKVKSDLQFNASQVVLGWKHSIDYGITFASVRRFDLLVIAAAKRVNTLDVRTVQLSC